MKIEYWKEIPGFENYYEASNLGKIRRMQTPTKYKDGRVAHFSQTVLKPSTCKKGYLKVYLSKNSKKYTIRVHQLIAKTFLENPEGKKTVNHKDLNKQNNSIDNLEWATNLENMRHAFANGCFKERDKKNATKKLSN